MDNSEYWAAQAADEVVAELEGRRESWDSSTVMSGQKAKWLTSYQYYYGRHFRTSSGMTEYSIQQAGKSGELSLVKANHYRNLIRHTLALTTNQKPSFDAKAINSDIDSINQARLANSILDAYLKDKKLGRNVKDAAEQALFLGTGFVYMKWEPTLGEAIAATKNEDGSLNMQYEGDVEASTVSVFDVLLDQSKEDFNKLDWFDVREFKNKFDLAASKPDMSDDIKELPSRDDVKYGKFNFSDQDKSNDVPVYAFYHKRTPSMPNGRYILYCSKEVILYDGPYPYSNKLNLFRIIPGVQFGSVYGYTDFFDVLSLQEANNMLLSTMVTNASTFGVQSVLIPEGSNVTVDQVSEGLSFIKYNAAAGKPEPLQLSATSPQTAELYQLTASMMEMQSGINSAARGNPESSTKSGVAISLVQSMAIQYTSQFQQSWAELLEDVGEFTLDLLRTFANTNRMVAMAGKFNKGAMQSFSKKDLTNVKRVVIELGNPMARTMAGRASIADALLGKGLIKNPQEYFTVLTSGSLEAMTEGPMSEISLIRQENESLLEGRFNDVHAIKGDAHILHAQEHKTLLSNPSVRMNGSITAAVLQHIAEHEQLYMTQEPFFAALSGEPPAPPQMMGPPPSMNQNLMAGPAAQIPQQQPPQEMPVAGPQQ
jgi:hypothetical protein